ncbi:MAG: hypothetical protein JSU87_12895 [Gemmatimonadota bacterium]|nr:MAG: hypothetical protein JSU87_12895 [Gemmatimonadota bacterium]
MGSRLSKFATIGVVAVLYVVATEPVFGEPYISVRTGLKCSACHVNRTGGGGRNDFGSAWAQTTLPMKTMSVRSRRLNDWLSVGFNFRAVGSLAVSRPESNPSSVPRTQAEISEAQVQIEGRFIDNILAFYVDQTVGPDRAFTREAFGLAEWRGKVPGFAKAGKFLLPYGWRLWDEEALIRSITGFTYATPDIGFELGIEPGPLTWSVAVTNGTQGASEGNSEKMFTSSAAVVSRHFRVGASGSYNGRTDSKTEVVGAFAGVTAGPVTVLGEADLIFDSFDDAATIDRDQFLAYIEGDVLVRKGVNIKISHGFHQPTASIRDEAINTPEDERTRTRVGLEVFPVSFVQVSGYFTRFDNAGDSDDLDRVSLEAHLHF